jgi:hypothetical protein
MHMFGISNAELFASFRKGTRNGNWKRLDRLEKAHFWIALWYAKRSGSIVNGELMKIWLIEPDYIFWLGMVR